MLAGNPIVHLHTTGSHTFGVSLPSAQREVSPFDRGPVRPPAGSSYSQHISVATSAVQPPPHRPGRQLLLQPQQRGEEFVSVPVNVSSTFIANPFAAAAPGGSSGLPPRSGLGPARDHLSDLSGIRSASASAAMAQQHIGGGGMPSARRHSQVSRLRGLCSLVVVMADATVGPVPPVSTTTPCAASFRTALVSYSRR